MNKKGGERYLTFWLFLVWIIIGTVVIMATIMFYNIKFDVNKVEAEVLSDRIIDCLVDRGVLNKDFFKDDFDIFKNCQLNNESFNKGIFYFNVSISDSNKILKNIAEGVRDFEIQCKLQEQGTGGEHLAGCKKRKFFVLDENSEKLIFEILTAAGQEGKRL